MASAARLCLLLQPLSALLLLLSSSCCSGTFAPAAATSLSPSSPQRRRLLQSSSPPSRNIETFFPSNALPAFANPPPPPPPPAPPFLAPSASRKPSRVTVAGAVVATAATTFVVSGLLFFALHRFAFRRRREVESYQQGGRNKLQGDGDGGGGNPYGAARVNGMLKAVVVDEDGLDVLYWRKLEDGGRKRCVHCMQVFGADGEDGGGGGGGDSGSPEQASGRRSRHRREDRRRVQETPLLPADSLSSSDRIKLVLSTESERSSMSVGAAPMRAAAEAVASGSTRQVALSSPSLPLPPGRRGAMSKSSSLSSSSSSLAPPAAAPQPPSADAAPPLPQLPPAPPPPTTKKSLAGSAPPAPPPPRPPPVGSKIPGPPAPPPPPGVGRPGPPPIRPPTAPRSSSKTAAAEGSEAENAKAVPTKLKPLHWDKMTTAHAQHSMVWDKISNGSFRFDDDLMEALFGYVATNRKSPKNGSSSSNPFDSVTTAGGGGPPGQICLLDSRKSQNTAIVLKSLAVARQEILDALMEGRGLSPDTLEKLSKLAPSKEEEETLLGFSGNPSSLADAESFLFHLLRAVPSAFARVDAMLFKANYEPEVVHLRGSLQALAAACKELRRQGLFWKMLEAVLKAGNRMNAGTARGNAQAFNLSSLRKLSDVKSTDGKTTLLHFVVESVVRNEGKRCVVNRNYSFGRSASRSAAGSSSSSPAPAGARTREEKEIEYMTLGLPVVGGLSVEFANVKKAAAVDYDALVGTCNSLGARMAAARKLLATCGGGGFVGEMSGFLERAEEELTAVREEQGRVVELVRKTTEYYMVGATQDRSAPPLQLFIVVKDFLGMVDQACVDISRNLQQRKRKAASAAASDAPVAPQKRSATRFPNLPAHFMSENSKSSSSSRGGSSNSNSDSEDEAF